MIIDVTGTALTLGNYGKDCLGNGSHFDAEGNLIECCCDECIYFMCCFGGEDSEKCKCCNNRDCPDYKGSL